MNKNYTKAILNMIEMLDGFSNLLSIIEKEEQDRFDKFSERTQESEKGEIISNNIELLSDAYNSICEASDYLNEIEDE